ncbi:MAG TPA: DUF1634 domain-containing protein [Candidatus Margulisiibacteriota bacterium]|nr:DUF1634 domain-containing protein [Candidatus Margulisiibacteriota bacterium]
MAQRARTHGSDPAATETPARFDMEGVVGYILFGGVLVSMALVAAGVTWRWIATGHVAFDYSITGMNLLEFVLTDIRQVADHALRPRLLVNLGIAVLMLTPYARVLASLLYFAVVERNGKFTLFTGFVLSVLTYSLFLR